MSHKLVLMLLALITKVVKLTDVEDVADFLTGNLAIMFVPPTVGVMACVDEMKKMLVPLFVISIVTTLLIMSVTGWATQGIMKGSKKSEEKNFILKWLYIPRELQRVQIGPCTLSPAPLSDHIFHNYRINYT